MSEQTLPATDRAWHLEARPVGRPTPLEFALPDFIREVGGWAATGKMVVRL